MSLPPLKSALKKSKNKKERKSVSFTDLVTVFEDCHYRTSIELPAEDDIYELHIPKNKLTSPPINTKRLKKLSQKGLSKLPLIVDKKSRKKQQLLKLMNLHQIDAAEEKRKRLLKINKKLGYPQLLRSNTVPLILRAKQKVLLNEQKQIILQSERLVVPCHFLLKPLEEKPYNENNNDDSNNNTENENEIIGTENEPTNFELLWLEQLGHGIFCLFENIKHEVVVSEAKLFFHSVKLVSQEECSVTLKLASLSLSQVISTFYNGKDSRKKKEKLGN